MRKSVSMILGLALLLTASQLCSAATIALTSSSNGVYDYGLNTTSSGIIFSKGQTITLSGLSGVTGALVSGTLSLADFTVQSFSSTSVVFAETAREADFGGPATFGTLVVDSSVQTTGIVDYSVVTANEGTLAGTTQGPVPAPEPGSMLLLGVVLLAFTALAALRKRTAVVTT